MKVDEIHDEIIGVDYLDLQALLSHGPLQNPKDWRWNNRIRLQPP